MRGEAAWSTKDIFSASAAIRRVVLGCIAVALFENRSRLFLQLSLKSVDHGMVKSGDFAAGCSLEIEDDDIVLASLQPGCRHKESALRTYVPETAEATAIDPE